MYNKGSKMPETESASTQTDDFFSTEIKPLEEYDSQRDREPLREI